MRHVVRPLKLLVLVTGGFLLAACTDTSVNQDPYESTNRKIHAFNKSVDRGVIRPLSKGYAAVVPAPVRSGTSNVVVNLRQPVNFINHTLQGDVQDAGATFFRFAVNTVFGLGGLLDPASDAGLFEIETDFGETLAVWGVPSGAYQEIPFYGPSTERDSFGALVNVAINPMTYIVAGDAGTAYVAAQGLDLLQERHIYSNVIDTLLYESADSYLAARIAFFQNRARDVNDDIATDDLEDPFAFE